VLLLLHEEKKKDHHYLGKGSKGVFGTELLVHKSAEQSTPVQAWQQRPVGASACLLFSLASGGEPEEVDKEM